MPSVLVLGLLLPALAAASGYQLTWSETFESLDNWVLDVEPGMDSGNNEWEYYTDSSDNVFLSTDPVSGANMLVLQALAQEHLGYNYTSGKVYTKEVLGPYGFYNVRAKVPHGLGLWPAIWMLPVTENHYGTWAACGEIDLMETVCYDPNAYATLHFGGSWPNNTQTPSNGHNTFPMSINWDETHNWGFEWDLDHVQFWFDAEVVDGEIQGQNFFSINSTEWYSTNSQGIRYPGTAPFDVGFNMILNIAVGGWWPCSVAGCCENVESQMPAQMLVYWVQTYQQTPIPSFPSH